MSDEMTDRTIWIVRIIGISIFLLMAYLMLDLYSKLHEISDEPPQARTTRATSD